ncbi:MAG: tetratricopeptide repeat protein, partial [Cyanobacteria bacterium]|nr:tetratricopeptide repeat protein [Cyanobacteriota bacterium]
MFSRRCKKNSIIAMAFLVGLQMCNPQLALAKDEWTTLTDEGLALKQSGNLKDAEAKLLAAYRLAKSFSDMDVRKATATDNLAEILEAEGRLAAAELHYQEGLDIRDRIYGKGTPLTARAQFNLGRIKTLSGEYIKAKPYLTRALEHREDASAENVDQPLAEILFTLGKIESNTGRLAKAKEYFSRSLKMHEALARHKRAAETWSQLALVSLAQNRLIDADTQSTTALININKNLQTDKLAEADALDTVARVKLALKHVSQAQDISGQAARLRREQTGSISDCSADSLVTSGLVKLKQSKFAESDKCFSNAIQIFASTRGSSDKCVQDAYFGRSFARMKQGQLLLARSDFDHAMALLETKVDKYDPLVIAYSQLYADHIGNGKSWIDAMQEKANLDALGGVGEEAGELDSFGALLTKVLPDPKFAPAKKDDSDALLKAFGVMFATICLIV